MTDPSVPTTPVPNHNNDTSANTDFCLNIISWNLAGRYDSNVLLPEFEAILMKFDVVLIQETHLYESELLQALEGFTSFSRPQRSSSLDSPWGGVATLVRDGYNAKIREEFCGPDLLTVEVNGTLFFNSYILPENTRTDWNTWTDVHPREALQDAIELARDWDLPFIVMGDLNARIASKSPNPNHLTRLSPDCQQNTWGRWLLELCDRNNLCILNGCEGIPGSHNK
ncbi:hypothetical protein K435DRAFT_859919 [Dendrothele bispora CBS 962.96]|uniref:Endonuclease/exonuclease/phosphatase domain-containing protein n=1 Tax=Dendrothele bispora (strain CBS 962.96) TaxID=1314807 RepID=A0A4S8LZB6_DENBC|nr:hypothetical protein K435DRAFT_859919 [Dendrothele bispora CBS 962.96]